jgi:hypothetical protein
MPAPALGRAPRSVAAALALPLALGLGLVPACTASTPSTEPPLEAMEGTSGGPGGGPAGMPSGGPGPASEGGGGDDDAPGAEGGEGEAGPMHRLDELPCQVGGLGGTPTVGPGPKGAQLVTCLEIHNDRAAPRHLETARSAIPLPASLGIKDPRVLAVIDGAGRRVPADLVPIARWGGPLDDASRPIRWLEVAAPVDLEGRGRGGLALVRAAGRLPPTPGASIDARGDEAAVDTGAARWVLDPTSPALLKSGALADGTKFYAHQAGAGPRVVLGDGTVVTQAKVEHFEVTRIGPGRVTVVSRGRFETPPKYRCKVGKGYDPLAWTAELSFGYGRHDVELQLELRNECSDLEGPPWTDQDIELQRAEWRFSPAIAAKRLVYGATKSVVAVEPGASLEVRQDHGAGSPWSRRAFVRRGKDALEAGVAFPSPYVGVVGDRVSAGIQLGWMRFREPQALVWDGKQLAIQLVSDRLPIGEARGIWAAARLGFVPSGELGAVETDRQAGLAMLERGLLVRAPRDHVNASGVFPSLGRTGETPLKKLYVRTLRELHDGTVNLQWPAAKTYGSQLWPDIPIFGVENREPGEASGEMNYWNPTRSELLEHLRMGDPELVWGFALPQTWTQLVSAYANVGEQPHGNRNGFALTSGGCGWENGCCHLDEPLPDGCNAKPKDRLGHWNRTNSGSDDYTYTHGDVAYVVRPSYGVMRRFAQAGRTVIRRYDDKRREQYVSEREINRQQMQHFALLASCAEFVPGDEGKACHDKLLGILTELARDNLKAGVLCQADKPSKSCLVPQQFMQNALHLPLLHRLYRNYGDVGGTLRRALVEAPWHTYLYGLALRADERPKGIEDARRTLPNPNLTWTNQLSFTLDPGGTRVAACPVAPKDGELWAEDPPGSGRSYQKFCALHPDTDPGVLPDPEDAMIFPNRPHTLAVMLMAHELEPKLRLCAVAKTLLDDPAVLDFWTDYTSAGPGWMKGTAQMMQSMVFGVGVRDQCE